MKCGGCGRDLAAIDVFHVRDCTSKQASLDTLMKKEVIT